MRYNSNAKLEGRPRLRHQSGSLQMDNDTMRRPPTLKTIGSHHSSFDRSMTIPEDELLTHPTSFQREQRKLEPTHGSLSLSSGDSPTASVISLPNAEQPMTKHGKPQFCRSQTGPALVNKGPWSRYKTSVNSSTSSLVSTSSTTILLPKHSVVSIGTPDLDFGKKIKQRVEREIASEPSSMASQCDYDPPSITTEGCDSPDPFDKESGRSLDRGRLGPAFSPMCQSASLSSLTDSSVINRRNSFSSAWKKASKSCTNQMKHLMDMFGFMSSSVSMGRLDQIGNDKECKPNLSFPPMRPPFYAYKVLPYIWVGDMRSADNEDLLSDGGGDDDKRKIRRRVYVDFRPCNGRYLQFTWPNRKGHILDYALPFPKRHQLKEEDFYNIFIEFCKLVNKARRDTKEGTQVLVYGPSAYNLSQVLVIGYIIAMYREEPIGAFDLVARSAPTIKIEITYIRWLLKLRSFLDSKKKETLGKYRGDMIRIRKQEAEKLFNRDYIISRSEPFLTKDWKKFVVNTNDLSLNSPLSKPNIQIPFRYDDGDRSDNDIMYETFNDEDEPLTISPDFIVRSKTPQPYKIFNDSSDTQRRKNFKTKSKKQLK